MYDLPKNNLPKFNLPKFKYKDFQKKIEKAAETKIFWVCLGTVILVVLMSYYISAFSTGFWRDQLTTVSQKIKSDILKQHIPAQNVTPLPDPGYVSNISYEQAVINSVQEASPSVVSIVISKNMPVYQQELIDPMEGQPDPGFGDIFNFQIPKYVQKGTEYQEVGAGSGFFVSEDGLVLTNKHVVSEKNADYTVISNEGKKYSAKVVALDPVQDLAIIKIQSEAAKNGEAPEKFPAIKIGDSSGIKIGQGAIAIGNALGQFSNTVSVGVVSGLGRTVQASGSGGFSETLEDIIQTDTAINSGNSGGPLINLKGEVIGINTAMADGAQSIGFAIPINIAKKDIQQVIKSNKIVYPFLGVRYVLIDEKVKKKYDLSVDYGALVIRGDNGEPAVTKDSPAQKAGIKTDDVIFELNNEKITQNNSLAKIIQKYSPGDKVNIKFLRDDKEITVELALGERS